MPRSVSFIGLAILPVLLSAPQESRTSTNQRKAQFVYNFLLFVSWPPSAMSRALEPIRVQIIGPDPFDGELDRLMASKLVDARPIVVTHASAPTATVVPHVAVISAALDRQLATVLAAYCHSPVLTVSDLDRFANRGGVIGLVDDGRVIRFAINQTAASEARLQVSAKLFHLSVPLFSAVSPCRAQ